MTESTFRRLEPEPAPLQLSIVTLDEFVAIEEPGADALLGEPDEALIPADGDVMVYGDGGAGKTTLCIDLACHLAAGDDWLGVHVAGPLRVLLIENEGPRPQFRKKLRRKRDGWQGSPVEDRILVLEVPWAALRLDVVAHREALAAELSEEKIDVCIVGPLTRIGMEDAGTLQEVRDFMALVADVRQRASRRAAFVLIHHENKGGKVSGAWEAAGDTLLHVQGQGHGRTRLYIQKARWASSYHATSLQLRWTDGEGFAVEDAPELDDEQLGEQILAAIAADPGLTWTKVEEATKGVKRQRRRDVRDGLLATGQLVNVRKEDGLEVALAHLPERAPSRLFLSDDPTIAHLRPARGADGAQIAPARAAGGKSASAPCAPPLKGRRGVGADSAQPRERFEPPALPLGDAGFSDLLERALRGGHITATEATGRLDTHDLIVRAGVARR